MHYNYRNVLDCWGNEGMSVKGILVVDDDPISAELARAVAVMANWDCRIAHSCKDMVSAIDAETPDLIALDLVMPDEDGLVALRRLRDWRSLARIVLITAHDPRYLDTARALGETYGLRIVATMRKPLNPESFAAILKRDVAH